MPKKKQIWIQENLAWNKIVEQTNLLHYKGNQEIKLPMSSQSPEKKCGVALGEGKYSQNLSKTTNIIFSARLSTSYSALHSAHMLDNDVDMPIKETKQ